MSPFIDDRGRLFGRVSVVDIIVLLLIVAVAAFAWARFAGDQTKIKDYRMDVFIAATRVPQVDQSNVGDTVRDEGGAVLGQIVQVSWEFTKLDPVDEKAVVHPGASTFLWDITITIKGQAQVSGSGDITVGGSPMRKGLPLLLVGPTYSPKTVIIQVDAAK